MLSRLKRRTPSSVSAEHDRASAEYTQDYIDQAHSIASQGAHLDPNSLSPTSTRSRGATTSSGSSQSAARTLSPSRPQYSGKRQTSRTSSFGSFTDRPDMKEGGRYVAVREPGGGQNIGAGSLTLDHLDAPASSAGDRSSTILVRAPELMVNTGVPSSASEGDTHSRDSASSVESSDLRTPVPGGGGQEQYFASKSYSRSRSNTTNEPPSSTSLNGLQALAGLNGSPGIAPSYPSSSSLNPSTASASGPHSRSSSRPTSRRSSITSQQPLMNGDSLRPPVSTSPAQIKPTIRKQRSAQGGIAGALALSGAALAGAPVRTAAASLGGIGTGSMGRDSTDSMDADGRSDYGGDGSNGLVSVDQMGDFDDVVSQLGTGYAVASSKRNAEFHAIFKSIPDDDYLIEDYGCALQREILIQGRLYISEHHLSFNANIFGWVTTLTLPFAEVVSIEKRMTAYVIPNAIQVTTMHARHTFASFLSRDTTYDLIGSIWRMVHPVVPASAALPDSSRVMNHLESEDEHDKYDVDGGSIDGHDDEPTGKEKPRKKRLRGLRRRGDTGASSDSKGRARADTTESNGGAQNGAAPAGGSRGGTPRSDAKLHPTTVDTCPTLKNLKEVCMDSIFPSAPEKIYNLMFTSGFMKDFWSDNQKLLELQISDWAPEKSGSNLLARSMSYIKPLNGAIGPKQTKCLITDESAHVDFDDYVCVITTTRTPDVPSGSVFSVKTRTSMTWAKGNSCRVIVTTGVEWTGRSFVKGIIERSCIDGQKTYHADLEKAMRAYIHQHRSEFLEEGQDVDSQSVVESASDSDSNDRPNGLADSLDDLKRGDEGKGGPAMAVLRAVVGTLSDLVGGLSPTSAGLAFVVLVLVLSNLWTLASRPSSGSSSRSSSRAPPLRGSPDRTPDQVALAVRDVLRDYFSDGVGRVAPVSVDPTTEVADIRAVLDGLEERIARLRGALEQME